MATVTVLVARSGIVVFLSTILTDRTFRDEVNDPRLFFLSRIKVSTRSTMLNFRRTLRLTVKEVLMFVLKLIGHQSYEIHRPRESALEQLPMAW